MSTALLLLLLTAEGGPPPVVPEAEVLASSEGASYTLLVRDRRTLELLGELPRYEDVTWTRRKVEAGSFALTIHNDSPPPATPGGDPDRTLIAAGRLLEVRRNGVFEFAGVIEQRELNSITGVWTLRGPDLLGHFMARRGVGLETADVQTAVPAETAMKHYLDVNAGATAVADRQFTTELSGKTFTIEADQARGATVDFSATRRNLLSEVLVPLARAGDLLQEVTIVPSGYEYRVSVPVTSPAVPFAVSWLNVAELAYRESLADLRNAVYVLGEGSGDARSVTLVTDGDSITADGRREVFLDARDATTAEQLEQAGQTEIAQRLYERVTATAQPLEEGSRYRVDFDVGQDVELSIPEAGVDGLVRRVTAVTVELSDGGETIKVELGAPARTLPVLVAEALRRGVRSQVV